MVYVTGDCHGDYSRFSDFYDQSNMTRDDIMIVCGDFGIWHDNADERERLQFLEDMPFTTVFVDGNHENFDRLYGGEFPIVDFHGGKAHQIRPHIYHLMRGYVFTFDGKKFFAFGGASSHDIDDGILDPYAYDDPKIFDKVYRRWKREGKMFRVNHFSWWEQELPTREEMDFGLKTLEENNFEVDYIISHCCPQEIASVMGFHNYDILTQYFNTVASDTMFKRWYFGHYHSNQSVYGKFILLYWQIERVV